MSLVGPDINISMNNIVDDMQNRTDKHAPIKQTSNKRKRQLRKPWISDSILMSIQKKHKLLKTHYLSGNPDKIRYCKIFNNKLNKVKSAAGKNYFELQFALNKNNVKMTWKLIGTMTNRHKKEI